MQPHEAEHLLAVEALMVEQMKKSLKETRTAGWLFLGSGLGILLLVPLIDDSGMNLMGLIPIAVGAFEMWRGTRKPKNHPVIVSLFARRADVVWVYAGGPDGAPPVNDQIGTEIWIGFVDGKKLHLPSSPGGTRELVEAIHSVVPHATQGAGYERHDQFKRDPASLRLEEPVAN